MKLFVGLDVSLEKTAICVVSEHGKIVKEVQVASEPEALLRWIFKQDCCRSGFITDYPKQASLSG